MSRRVVPYEIVIRDSTGPCEHNCVWACNWGVEDAQGNEIALSPGDTRALFVRLANEMGVSLKTTSWPTLAVRTVDMDNGYTSTTYSMFAGNRVVSIKGTGTLTTLYHVAQRLLLLFLQHGVRLLVRQVRVGNVQATLRLPGALDMDTLHNDPNTTGTYDPTQIRCLVYKDPADRFAGLYWPPGRVVLVGPDCADLITLVEAGERLIRNAAPHVVSGAVAV